MLPGSLRMCQPVGETPSPTVALPWQDSGVPDNAPRTWVAQGVKFVQATPPSYDVACTGWGGAGVGHNNGSATRQGVVEPTLERKTGNHMPLLTVRSKIPSVARSADSGTIGKRSLRSPLTFDQS
jgi:hypothetical protein